MPKAKRSKQRVKNKQPTANTYFEAEILPGLKDFAISELKSQHRQQVKIIATEKPDQLCFQFLGKIDDLLRLRKAVAIFQLHHFDVPRPRALMGHQNLQMLFHSIQATINLHPVNTFSSFTFSAAGRDSAVFSRLAAEISQQVGLRYVSEEADLLIRMRPALLANQGWDVLVRLSPRPLSVRPWRVCDMPGALNATIAAAMVELVHPKPQDRFLNLMTGSGTLLIERHARCPGNLFAGGDLSQPALACATQNIQAAGLSQILSLTQFDATKSPFANQTFNLIYADLPWGQLVGSRQENQNLYPLLLTEAARLATHHGKLVLLTHQINLMENVLKAHSHLWHIEQTVQVYQGGLHPKIYLLKRVE